MTTATSTIEELANREYQHGFVTDIEAEFTMTLANRKLDASVETVFLMADEQFTHVSSSLLKQITPLATDQELAR